MSSIIFSLPIASHNSSNTFGLILLLITFCPIYLVTRKNQNILYITILAFRPPELQCRAGKEPSGGISTQSDPAMGGSRSHALGRSAFGVTSPQGRPQATAFGMTARADVDASRKGRSIEQTIQSYRILLSRYPYSTIIHS